MFLPKRHTIWGIRIIRPHQFWAPLFYTRKISNPKQLNRLQATLHIYHCLFFSSLNFQTSQPFPNWYDMRDLHPFFTVFWTCSCWSISLFTCRFQNLTQNSKCHLTVTECIEMLHLAMIWGFFFFKCYLKIVFTFFPSFIETKLTSRKLCMRGPYNMTRRPRPGSPHKCHSRSLWLTFQGPHYLPV